MRSITKICLPLLTVICLAVSSVAVNADQAGKRMNKLQMKFSKVDSNGDSAITKEEQLAFAEQHFDDADADKDGMVTLKELKMLHLKRRMDHLENQSNP